MKIKLTKTIAKLGITQRVVRVIRVAPFGIPSGILASIFGAKGDLIVGTGPGTYQALPAGADGRYLKVDSAQPGGFSYDNPIVDPSAGWLAPGGNWSFSSVDGPTGVASADADLTAVLQNGMRLSWEQVQALTAYWNLDANSNSQVGAFNGTDTNVVYAAGKFSNGATFNGASSKIVIADHASLKPTGEFTIGFWIKAASAAAVRYIFQSFSSNTNHAGFAIYLGADDKLNFFTANNTGTTSGVNNTSLGSVSAVADNTWHYVVITFRANYGQMYIDGRLQAAGYMLTPAYAVTNYVRMGCNCGSGVDGLFLSGQLDDVFFINGYALDEQTTLTKYRAASAQGTGNITISKKAIITKVGDYSGGATLITFYCGNDYSLANAAISSVRHSAQKGPYGFPTNPAKWTLRYSSEVTISQATPVANTVYNLGSILMDIPIGMWIARLQLAVSLTVTTAAAANISINGGLSTQNNAFSDNELRGSNGFMAPILTGGVLRATWNIQKLLRLLSKTRYYLDASSSVNGTSLDLAGTLVTTIIEVVSAYL